MLEHLVDKKVVFKRGRINSGVCIFLSIEKNPLRSYSNRKSWTARVMKNGNLLEIVCWLKIVGIVDLEL